jgi:hypothetical protein
MVLPLLGALIGGAASVASAIIGGNAQSAATQYNWAANERNLQAREKERKQTMDYAEKVRAEEKLGGTDAGGNRTRFVEGEGWVTELSDRNKALQDYFYGTELPERQGQFQRLASQSRKSDDVANGLLAQFRRIVKENPAEIEALLMSVASRGINEGTRDAIEPAMRSAARTGNSNVSKIIGEIARNAQEARKEAAINSKLQAKDYVQQSYDSKRGTNAQLYNQFLSQSGLALNPSMDPTAGEAGANNLMAQFLQAAQAGKGIGFNAVNKQGGTRMPIEPDMGMANAIGASGVSIASMLERMGSGAEKMRNNNALRDYISVGGQLDMNEGGIFGRSADRLKAQQGLY